MRRVPSMDAPIGVFDSGVGGLSVLRALRQALPNEDLVYAADSAHAPYGDRDADYVVARTLRMADILVERGVKAVVVACNTATVLAIDRLRATHSLPIVAMEPAIKPGVQQSRSGVIGVLATHRTLASPSVARLCERHGADVDIILTACPGLVEEVERGHFDTPEVRRLLASFAAPALDRGADTLVLGCTHYVFLTAILRELVGPDIGIVDSTDAVVREVARRVGTDAASAARERRATVTFLSTGASAATRDVFARVWGRPVEVEGVA